MKYGVVIFPTDYAIRSDELAKAAEQRGFESIFFPEHNAYTNFPPDALSVGRRVAARILAYDRPIRRDDNGSGGH
jgi:alkanesulfonate monooxygenase SsuD/methylene tetrahydromethanopterin reductase-like flavin-dependent oxidoreductase (luciferase family)